MSDVQSASETEIPQDVQEAISKVMEDAPWPFGDANRTLISVDKFADALIWHRFSEEIKTKFKACLDGFQYIDLEN